MCFSTGFWFLAIFSLAARTFQVFLDVVDASPLLGLSTISFLKFSLVLLFFVQYFGQLNINTCIHWPVLHADQIANLCTSVKRCMSNGIHIIVETLNKAGQNNNNNNNDNNNNLYTGSSLHKK